MTQKLFDHHGSVEFDWDKIEGEVNPEAVAMEIVVGVISFVLAFVYSGTAKPQTAYRRFLAITYIVRPDLLPKKSMGNLGKELGVVKSEIARHVNSIRDELKLHGRNLIPVAARLRIKAGQLKSREAKKSSRKKNEKRKTI